MNLRVRMVHDAMLANGGLNTTDSAHLERGGCQWGGKGPIQLHGMTQKEVPPQGRAGPLSRAGGRLPLSDGAGDRPGLHPPVRPHGAGRGLLRKRLN